MNNESGQGEYNPATKIIGGEEAAVGAWPWQAFLEIEMENGTYACGGSLVATNWVLTAGHCLDGASGIILVR